ncbi:MAG: bifunctional hydroxymethylpyrimidine kinase/phosphomethylpyrimidine kinase [Myxococcota bacterium]|nr:bifunctional hydroxymethylpyrimidine kinase/phosphomethylpyrimidine kinase [Myxococcota bacterium]
MRIALTIAASDPTGGAGLQADLQVFRKLGVHGAGVVAALTVQDSKKVHRILPVFPSVALEQLRTLLSDVQPHAIKIGALGSDDVVRNVALGLEGIEPEVPIVLDPVLFSSGGAPLLERRAWAALEALCGVCELVTPNLPEAEALSGRDVSRRAGVEDAARFFVEELGAGAVLVKGGHRKEAVVADLLAAPDGQGALAFDWLESERIDIGPVHGTGCALSSAITAFLATGAARPDAVANARAFVADAIEAAERPGDGAHFLVYS